MLSLKKAILAAQSDADINCFDRASAALEFAKTSRIDVAFLDIRMGGMDGLTLARKLKDIYGNTNIIFVTGYDDYALTAFNMHVSGYVLKPFETDRIRLELENLRNPVKKLEKGIVIQCFGNFEIYVEGKPITFGRARSKEALAYLIDRRGASVSNGELAAILWEDGLYDRSRQKQLDVYIAEMIRSLEQAGAGGIVIKEKRGFYSVDIAKVKCDYYDSVNGDVEAINSYHGEYMRNYSWAEFTAGLFS